LISPPEDAPLDPREEIAELEVRIEELADALERCRKFALAARIAIGLGALLLTSTLFGFLTFTPMALVGGVAALLGGIVLYGSNASTSEELTKSLRNAEARRAGLIGRLDIRLVHDAPPTLH
jgi:hypothetical protein